MTRPRFLADQDLNDGIVSGIERIEPLIEFVRARDLRLHELPDDEVLAFASQN